MFLPQVILYDVTAGLTSELYASRPDAAILTGLPSGSMKRFGVSLSLAPDFDPARDYLLRVVRVNGKSDRTLVVGTMPIWAGGPANLPRCRLAPIRVPLAEPDEVRGLYASRPGVAVAVAEKDQSGKDCFCISLAAHFDAEIDFVVRKTWQPAAVAPDELLAGTRPRSFESRLYPVRINPNG